MKRKTIINKTRRDEAIQEVLSIIQSHCDRSNKILSFHDIGVDLEKIGISTKTMRAKEWDDLQT